jgi:tRNA-dihydrouridine synthase B
MGNGDIFTAQDAVDMMKETGCDGVMVARGAQGNPWIFQEIACLMDGRQFVPPTLEERLTVALEHARDLIAEKGERVGIAESRKHMAWYMHDVRGAAAARNLVMSASTLDEVEAVLNSLKDSEEV